MRMNSNKTNNLFYYTKSKTCKYLF